MAVLLRTLFISACFLIINSAADKFFVSDPGFPASPFDLGLFAVALRFEVPLLALVLLGPLLDVIVEKPLADPENPSPCPPPSLTLSSISGLKKSNLSNLFMDSYL